MMTLLTPDSRNLFDNPVLDFEHGSLMLKIDKQSLRKPPPSLILSFIKTDFCPSVAVEELSLLTLGVGNTLLSEVQRFIQC